MNNTTNKRILLLVAAGLLSATSGATEATAAIEQCQIADPENDPGGEVSMSPSQLQQAQPHPAGGWVVRVEPSDLAGITVPAGLEVVKVRLTDAQRATAVDLAQNGSLGKATFAVHSQSWVEETEQRLLGGFSVLFNGPLCPYGGPTWT